MAYALIMDFILLFFLAVTIFYAVRLTRSLNEFRQYRQEFGKVITELSRNIERADGAVKSLKETSRESGESLQEIIDEARLLSDELQLIYSSGNNLAKRLEKLSAQRGETAALSTGSRQAGNENKAAEKKEPFRIQDRDFEGGASGPVAGNDEQFEMDEAGVPEQLQSRAERELLEALKNNRNS